MKLTLILLLLITSLMAVVGAFLTTSISSFYIDTFYEQINAVFGDEWHTVCGEGFFGAEDMGIKFRAGANTFLQVNEGVRNDLYRQIVAEAADGGAVAIDLYSGGGMLTAMLAENQHLSVRIPESGGLEISGNLDIRSGEFFYFQKNFYITEGSISFPPVSYPPSFSFPFFS